MTLKELYESKSAQSKTKIEKPIRPIITRTTVPVSQLTVSANAKALILPNSKILCGYLTAMVDGSCVEVVAENPTQKNSTKIFIEKKNELSGLDIDFINKLVPCVISLVSENECLLTLQMSIGEVDATVTENKSNAVPFEGNES